MAAKHAHHVVLTAVHSHYVTSQVARGHYASVSEVVRAALRLMIERDQAHTDLIHMAASAKRTGV